MNRVVMIKFINIFILGIAIAQDMRRLISYKEVFVGADCKQESRKNVNFGYTSYDVQIDAVAEAAKLRCRKEYYYL